MSVEGRLDRAEERRCHIGVGREVVVIGRKGLPIGIVAFDIDVEPESVIQRRKRFCVLKT